MGYYEDLYNSMSNPLDNDQFLDYLIDCYSDSKNIYNSITRFNLSQKQYHKGEYYPAKRDAFWVKMFNIWKSSVLSLSDKQISYAQQNNPGYYGRLVELINYLKSMPEVKTADEFWALANDENNLISRYGFQTLGEYSSWYHIDSAELSFHKHRRPPVEHRLYINGESIDTFDIASLFTDKCMEVGIPFYYKFDDYANRDDSLVIYSSSKYLKYYIEILRQLKKDNPELFSRICDPPAMSGVIDGWIGYGSEPTTDSHGKLRSFNEVRSNALERALNKTTNEWIFRNVNKRVRQGDKTITIGEILENRMVNSAYNQFLENFERYNFNGKADAFYELYGLVEGDFTSGNFRELIRYHIHQNFNTIINKGLQDYRSLPTIKINTRDGKTARIYSTRFVEQFKKMGSEIRKNDPSYKKNLRRNIEIEYQNEGIDINKSCFDIDMYDELLEDDRAVEVERSARLREEEQKRVAEENRKRAEQQRKEAEQRRLEAEKQKLLAEQRRLEEENRKIREQQRKLEEQRRLQQQKRQREASRKAGVDFDGLCSMLDSSLLNRSMVLPSGKRISGREYLKLFVFPHIPEDGKFILKSGTEMSYLQFIDGFVMFIGQTEYSGDIVKLMEDNVVANKGTINIDGRRVKSSEIVNYCNPDALNRNVRFPNGKVGKARDYISTYFSKYIPENGKFILASGEEIDATKYIEKYVLGVGQTKYNGNASHLLFDTTRRNKGVLQDRRMKHSNELSQMLDDTKNISNNRGGRINGKV